MSDWLFDGVNRIIKEPPGLGNTSWDVDRDIYSAWKRWVRNDVGAEYPNAFIQEGGTPIGTTGFFTGTTVILTNGWKLQGADHDHQALVVGNIFSDDGVVTEPNPLANANVFVSASVAAQGVAAGSGLDATQNQRLTDLWQDRGFDSNNPVVVDTTASTITVAGRIRRWTGDLIKTLTQE